MIQTIKPDYYIKIGIKDDEIISLDWKNMNYYGCDIIIKVKKLLKKAIKYLDK
jgi:hypothetical protein